MGNIMENTYSAGRGKYQKELNKLHATYTSLTALHATDSARANSALKKLICSGRKYYRYYNDGDYPAGMGVPRWNRWSYQDSHSPERVQILENAFDKIVLKAWETTRHATLPPTHDILAENIDCRRSSSQSRDLHRFRVRARGRIRGSYH